MEFEQFKKMFQSHASTMIEEQEMLFVSHTDKDILWDTYLDSFPPGTNEMFRKRREYDCSCCRHFIKAFGNIVTIKDNKLSSLWDFQTNDSTYQPVIEALSEKVKSAPVKDVFLTKEAILGTDYNHQKLEDGKVLTWHHFKVKLPPKFVTKSPETIGTLLGNFRDVKNVFERSLKEISKDAIDTILELIAQKSLYKGEEWQGVLSKFIALHNEYHNLADDEKDNFCWLESVQAGPVVGKIRNHSIGTLLSDVSEGMDLNEAVKRYEKIVAPTNYKRPKMIFTKKMVEQAQETISDLGLSESLGRRHASANDITINNILFANRDTAKQMQGDVFSELCQEATTKPKKFDKVEEVSVEQFTDHILPQVTDIELLFENKHSANLMSVIAPKITESKTMFKWNNGFSWAYNGNITDSMKERVKKLGGKVDGVLRFSIQWNDGDNNQNDFDAHCIEPNRNHIEFPNKGLKHPSTGMLDVDIIDPGNKVAVENITWTDISKMKEGIYKFFVHNYAHNGGTTGFTAEIEYNGTIYEYSYNKGLRQGEKVPVATIKFTREEGIKFIESLPSSTSSRIIWGITTNQFHPVSVYMFSPNYWNGQAGIGNKHYFFILKNCENQDNPNGFFNEFIREDLVKHKRVFEALGSKMRVEESHDQLSGLGFSSTQRNSVVCKLKGSFDRMVRIIF